MSNKVQNETAETLSAQDAKAGRNTKHMRYVLSIGTIAAVVLLAVVFGVFAG